VAVARRHDTARGEGPTTELTVGPSHAYPAVDVPDLVAQMLTGIAGS
jgi:hypothetical protein